MVAVDFDVVAIGQPVARLARPSTVGGMGTGLACFADPHGCDFSFCQTLSASPSAPDEPEIHRDADDDVELVLRSGSLRELLPQLAAHSLDVVLTNSVVPRDNNTPWRVFKIGEQEASLVGRPLGSRRKFRFPDDLHHTPIMLPGPESSLRESFDTLMEQAGIRPLVMAEVDDMAMLRLVARESPGVALVPPVVVKDELKQRVLVEYARVTGLRESFFAVTGARRFGNPLLRELLSESAK